MLTPQQVLDYVKDKLGLPLNPVEYTDEQILKYIRQTSLRFFSSKLPDEHKHTFDLAECQTEIDNEFNIVDPDGLPIISIQNVYFDQGGLIIAGMPIMGLIGGQMSDAENYTYQTETGGTVNKYGLMNYYYEWRPPNILRIMPRPKLKPTLIEYERFHKPDFSTIQPQYEAMFLDLAYADVALWISRTRSIFRNFSTPFGDIELNPDDLKTEAQEIRNSIVEQLENVNMSIIVDSG